MNLKSITYVCCITAVLFFICSSAWAIGLGGFVNFGTGKTSWESDDDFEYTDDSSDSFYGIGFVLDTAVATNTIFNYRLNFGIEKWKRSFDETNDNQKLTRYTIANTFGFGVLRDDKMRIWLGPQIFFGYGIGSWGRDDWVEGFFGIGAAIGLNYHVDNTISLLLDVGLRRSGVWGTATATNNDSWDFAGGTTSLNINVGVIGRFGGDSYK